MSIETQKHFVGKTQTFYLSETQAEKLVIWTRFGIGFVYAVLSLVGFLINKISAAVFFTGLCIVSVLFVAGGYYLYRSRLKKIGITIHFTLIAIDATVITLLLSTYAVYGLQPLMHAAFFCAYFIVITFTALHYRPSLVLFGGIVSAAEYTAFYIWYAQRQSGLAGDFLQVFLIQDSILLLVTILSAIISRKNFETVEKVVSSERRYQTLVHRLPEMLFTMDANGYFLWSNTASYTILGIPAKALPHRNIRDFFTDPLQLKKGTTTRGTFEIHDFEGKSKFVDCIIQPVDTAEGNASWEGIIADVTDRELAISQREEMVNRLFQYQKMESLGSLASGVAHDFNNILQTIVDITGMVQTETHEDTTKQRMDLLTEATVDAKFLISELLAFGRNTPMNLKTINLRDFFEAIFTVFTEQYRNKYRTELVIPEDPVTVRGDHDYLKRLFQNLMVNARDAMPDGGTITVECAMSRPATGTGTVVIRFSDTGSGIPQAIQEKIFDPFFTTKKPGKGTGLGLAIVQRIASQHNGTVRVEKSDSKGTTFRIELPECDNADLEDTRWVLSNRINTRLLLLDDDPKIRDVLKVFLTEFGYTISQATDLAGATAELTAHKSECQVLIMDWKLGWGDPVEVIRVLREIRPGLIVIVVSGYPADQQNIERAGIRRWFTKPYDKNQLDLEIQKSLHNGKNDTR